MTYHISDIHKRPPKLQYVILDRRHVVAMLSEQIDVSDFLRCFTRAHALEVRRLDGRPIPASQRLEKGTLYETI